MAGHIGQEKRSKIFLARKTLERLKKKTTDKLKRKTDLRFGVRPLSSQTAHAIFHCRSSRSSNPNCCILSFPISCQSQPTKTKTTPYHILTPLFIITWSALHFSSSSKISGSYPSETASDSQARQSTAATTKSVSILKR